MNELIIVGVVAAVLILGGSVAGIVQLPGAPDCRDDGGNWFCGCPIGFEKSRTSDPTVYTCILANVPVPYEFPIDSNDPQYDGKALGYAQDYLRANFPDCNTISCPGFTDIGTMTGPEDPITYGYVECGEPLGELTGRYWWRAVFSLEDGTIHPIVSTYCISN